MIGKIKQMKYIPSFIWNVILMKLRGYQIGSKIVMRGRILIRGKGKVFIGSNVTINSCREANPIGGDIQTILYAKEGSKISIGNNVGISNAAIVAMSEIQIDDDVFIGGGCKLYDHDFHSIRYEERMSGDTNVKTEKITIKKGAFIGGHSIILKGVTVGERSVIGAGSVVTKNIPEGEIWGGNPAKFIRKIENI